MLVIPAIDLKGGKCVRLRQGDFSRSTVYDGDPVQMAMRFCDNGAERLHIIDLDGAETGISENARVVEAILAATDVPIQLGGGIRSFDSIAGWLARGIASVITGTLAINSPEILWRALSEYEPDRIILALDAKDGRVMTDGWQRQSDYGAEELALEYKEFGLDRVLYTDILRDGMFTGPNLKVTRALAEKTGLKVTASGGVSSTKDLDRLRSIEEFGVDSVVVGKAIYEKRIPLEELF